MSSSWYNTFIYLLQSSARFLEDVATSVEYLHSHKSFVPIKIVLDTCIILSLYLCEEDKAITIRQTLLLIDKLAHDQLCDKRLYRLVIPSITIFELYEQLWVKYRRDIEKLRKLDLNLLRELISVVLDRVPIDVDVNVCVDDLCYSIFNNGAKYSEALGWIDTALIRYCSRTGSYLLTIESGRGLLSFVKCCKDLSVNILHPCVFEILLLELGQSTYTITLEKDSLKRLATKLRDISTKVSTDRKSIREELRRLDDCLKRLCRRGTYEKC